MASDNGRIVGTIGLLDVGDGSGVLREVTAASLPSSFPRMWVDTKFYRYHLDP